MHKVGRTSKFWKDEAGSHYIDINYMITKCIWKRFMLLILLRDFFLNFADYLRRHLHNRIQTLRAIT